MVEKRDWLDFGLIAFWIAAWASLVYFVPAAGL
ncbi:hypothetical protein GCE9029_02964 [Grimontia celer]|uniref:Uncharacterized protein n=1 Tax=Grimontia celer TaxID=1796497 RepID=A0A128F5F6_9GAMM|nr:hypothetical protein GCE9029_02964 [Grimontia celer]